MLYREIKRDAGIKNEFDHSYLLFLMEEEKREKLVKGWHKAVGRSLDWAEH